MKLQVRKLMESDWDLIPKWWEHYNMEGFPRDMLPGAWQIGDEPDSKREGLGGFMVCKENDPIAAQWLWMTNSKTAIPAVMVADPMYRDNDRSDALQLLMDFTTDFAEDLGYKYAFGWAKPGLVLEKYKEAGYHIDETPSYETIMKF